MLLQTAYRSLVSAAKIPPGHNCDLLLILRGMEKLLLIRAEIADLRRDHDERMSSIECRLTKIQPRRTT